MAKHISRFLPVLTFIFFIHYTSCAQPLNKKPAFTHQDTLRGSITPERAWWNVVTYNIYVAPDYDSKKIKGYNEIGFSINSDGKNRKMQIDLQQPMIIDSITFDKKELKTFKRDSNIYIIDFGAYNFTAAHSPVKMDRSISQHSIKIFFHGNPRVAVNPPWDGGWIFTKDAKGRPWMTVACQGLGASVWYPCKDYQGDEPDNGATLSIAVADSLVAVGNGRLKEKKSNKDGTTTWTWQVKSPINNYDIVPYIGKYVTWHEDYAGEKGKLDCDYWVLDYDKEKAVKQFAQAKTMLKCFEHWMGPYPFYEDGYKLVESSHLGMEHQSAVAYGNKFLNGYLGMDLSRSGWGKDWDYIIVHESGHEWFANNITTNDIADMWVHEGFTDYSETLFVECQYGKQAGNEYTQGLRRNISNNKPVIGPYGVNQEGSGDMYNKGNNIIHMVRQLINDDEAFRKILRGLNDTFYHKTVNSKDVENYISKKAGIDFSKLFDQYLRTPRIPVLEYKPNGDDLLYRWTNCIDGFNMPVRIAKSGEWLKPTTEWQKITISTDDQNDFQPDKNFYVGVKKVEN